MRIFENIIALLFLLFWVMIVFALIYISFNEEVKGILNKRKGVLKDIHKLLTPKTPIQKEIEAERREIAILKRHKRDMEELEDLKRQKEQLWEEVHEEEHPKFKGDDYLLKNKNLQRNEISADDIIYKAIKKQSEHFEEIIREAEEEFEKRLTIIEK